MKYKISEPLPRSVLWEGRSQGMGFAFCKRAGEMLFTVQPVSPCKDYLNDVLYSEHTGKPYIACGLVTKKEDIFTYGKGYILFYICGAGASRNSEYPEMKKDIEALREGHRNIELGINMIENRLRLQTERTSIFSHGPNHYVAEVPLFWCQYTYLISLWSLMVRNLFRWDANGTLDPIAFLESKCDPMDMYNMKTALEKLKRMIDGEIPVQDWDKTPSPHGMGIVVFEFPNKVQSAITP